MVMVAVVVLPSSCRGHGCHIGIEGMGWQVMGGMSNELLGSSTGCVLVVSWTWSHCSPALIVSWLWSPHWDQGYGMASEEEPLGLSTGGLKMHWHHYCPPIMVVVP